MDKKSLMHILALEGYTYDKASALSNKIISLSEPTLGEDRTFYQVWYRGNGYGLFFTRAMGERFLEFLKWEDKSVIATGVNGKLVEVNLDTALKTAKPQEPQPEQPRKLEYDESNRDLSLYAINKMNTQKCMDAINKLNGREG